MRTDQTWVCARCAARFAAALVERERRCPGCGGTRLLDLTRPLDRDAAARAGSDPEELGQEPGGLTRLWLLPPPAPAPAARREVARGAVRATRTLLSPLRRVPCVAYRLLGRSRAGRIDDAGGTSFEIASDEDAPVEVELGPATVQIPVGLPVLVDLLELGRALLDFLVERGARPWDGRVELTESVVRDGARIEVRGTPERKPVPEGYRDGAYRRLFRDRPGSPLVIRRAGD